MPGGSGARRQVERRRAAGGKAAGGETKNPEKLDEELDKYMGRCVRRSFGRYHRMQAGM